ncbi:hypothetical protein DERP_013223 [Dermatophagoides pteronyssinus]|uniref:Uncharacterized protein n=1 Tax=Dermatophagoides pteronyssinus TaxID=6956 RepID=A0ABQ8IRK4_DERPT|nr:hypothetical protein DERP_013223 [Dermatophagoides pteronyssinus]
MLLSELKFVQFSNQVEIEKRNAIQQPEAIINCNWENNNRPEIMAIWNCIDRNSDKMNRINGVNLTSVRSQNNYIKTAKPII